jgi:hypothetical protein
MKWLIAGLPFALLAAVAWANGASLPPVTLNGLFKPVNLEWTTDGGGDSNLISLEDGTISLLTAGSVVTSGTILDDGNGNATFDESVSVGSGGVTSVGGMTFDDGLISSDGSGDLAVTGTGSFGGDVATAGTAAMQTAVLAIQSDTSSPPQQGLISNANGELDIVANSAITEILDTFNHGYFTGTLPNIGAGATDCGTSPVIAGNDNVGRVTVGSGANGGKCTLTFHHSWTSTAPVCTVADQTTANLVRPVVSVSTLAITGTLVPGDTLGYICRGYE